MSLLDTVPGQRSEIKCQVDLLHMRRRAIVSCVIGNCLEIYDFTLFGFFAIHIGRTFFPSDSPFVSLLGGLATFGVGFVMRPVGGMIMGAYADRFGRRSALKLTMAMMAIATGLVGILPGYASIGIWAPVFLVLCRLAQGFSTGGEWSSALVFLIEYATPKRRAFVSSWSQVGITLGTLAGSTSALLAATLAAGDSLNSWGWRIPFLAGFLLMPIGYYLRSRVDETPAFQQLIADKNVANAPLRECLSHHKTTILKIFGVCAIWAAVAYILFIYLPSFAAQVLGIDIKVALTATTIGSIVAVLLYPLMGLLSDRIGRRLIVQAANVAVLLSAYPLFRWMATDPGLPSLVGTMIAAGIFVAALGGAGSAMVTELTSARLRSTSVGIAYNLAVATFGGFAPLACAFLVRQTGQAVAPAYVLIFCSMISIYCVMLLDERAHVPLDDFRKTGSQA